MFRSKLILGLILMVAVIGGLALAQSGGGDKVANMEKKIAALEKKLAALEAKVTQLQQRPPAAGDVNAALESEANAEFGKISRMVSTGDYKNAQTAMSAFMTKYGATNAAKKARRLSTELSVFGKSAPASWDIEKWFQGESEIDLASDKTTLLVFWEIWCPHCKREVPKMQALYDNLKDDGLQLVGLTRLTRSTTEEQITKFISDQKVKYPIAKENGEVAKHFKVSGIPAAAVVKDGKVIWRGHPGQLTETKLKGWL